MVSITVGEPAILLYVHEGVLRSKIPFFTSALSRAWRKENEMLVRLPDDHVDIVNFYIN